MPDAGAAAAPGGAAAGTSQSGDGRVNVFARVRPASGQEAGFTPAVQLDDEARLIRVRNEADAVERVIQAASKRPSERGAENLSAEAREFTFDGVFPEDSTQREVFTKVGLPVLRECMKGFNGTILAYGQTGSGKTHSLLHQGQKSDDAGLLPRLVASLFVQIAQDGANVYEVEAAAVQVYNEQVDDLLHPDHQSGGGQNLSVRDGGSVPGLTWIQCRRPETMLEAFTHARANLVYAETKMNKASSRSHAVFQVRIAKRKRGTDASASAPQRVECTNSRLSVVDLAGSERVKKSGVEGAHFKEATAINRSLLAFGNVVSALAAKKAHVPLRDSKLTRILDGSIGGNCKTALLVCASPAAEHAQETLSTLEFASRAMRIEVDAKVNTSVVEVSAKALLADLSNDDDPLGGRALGPELEALRKKSAAAAENARKEVERREKAMAEAASQTKLLQQAAQDAEEQGRRWQAEAQDLQQTQHLMAGEAERLRLAAGAAERRAEEGQLAVQAKEKQFEDLQVALKSAERTVEECRKLAEVRAKEAVQAQEQQARAETSEAAKHREELMGVRQEAASHNKQANARVSQAAARLEEALARVDEAEERAEEAVARARAVEDAAAEARMRAEGAEEALAELRRETEWRETAASEQVAAERWKAADALRTAAAELEATREQGDAARQRSEVLEADLSQMTKELRLRDAALEEARAALGCLREEAAASERQLREAFRAELEALRGAHLEEAARLEGEAREALCCEQARRVADVAALKATLAQEEAQWSVLRADLEASREEALGAQRADFEARLRAGKEELEARLAGLERQAQAEREGLHQELQEERDCFERAQVEWRAQKEEAVREAWEGGNVQQRRLAAAFKAARHITELKESELREAHDDLAQRFAARESREDDVRQISEQQRRINDQRRALQHRDDEVRGLGLELQNRDETDRIFSAPELRRSRTEERRNVVPSLPGKKLGDQRHFVEREKCRRSAQMGQRSSSVDFTRRSFLGCLLPSPLSVE